MENLEEIIRLSKTSVTSAEKQAVMRVLDHEFLGMGNNVQLFEQKLSCFFNRPAVCVVNGTAALHLALQACGIGHGDEVLVQSLTYIASFQAISATGAIPIACDIDLSTLTLDWHDAEKRITSKTKAIMPVHYAGGVGKLNEIYDFAKKYNLRVIEDAAHAFGTIYQGKKIGSIGDIACFSFDGIKNISSGEGGCIVTKDQEILQSVRDNRLLGVKKDTEKRYKGTRSWEFDVTDQGWRYHMSNIMAAIGTTQLDRFPQMSEKRKELAMLYDQLLQNIPYISLLKNNYQFVTPHIYVICIDDKFNRVALRSKLSSLGIQTGIHYQPNHELSFYRNNNTDMPLRHTDSISRRILSMPLHVDLTDQQVKKVCAILKDELS